MMDSIDIPDGVVEAHGGPVGAVCNDPLKIVESTATDEQDVLGIHLHKAQPVSCYSSHHMFLKWLAINIKISS